MNAKTTTNTRNAQINRLVERTMSSDGKGKRGCVPCFGHGISAKKRTFCMPRKK
jgi:hypothetical protein